MGRYMEPYYSDQAVTIYHGDCREVLAQLPDTSVDSVVTDPPYELGFMGKRWDASGIAYDADLWAEALRVLKPGGHLLAFGGTRTWHRLAVAIEDAGFEIRDSIAWMYGSGFPKSLDVSKAIDKVNGEGDRLYKFTAWMRTTGLTARELNDATGTFMGSHYLTAKSQPAIPTPDLWALIRPLCGQVPAWVDELVQRIEAQRQVVAQKSGNLLAVAPGQDNDRSATVLPVTAPATPDAARWQGWGTALKPAHEPIVVARKPLIGTVAANVLEHGTGALNIDGCRIGTESVQVNTYTGRGPFGESQVGEEYGSKVVSGRWPANVVLDEDQAAALDEQSGWTSTGKPSATAKYGQHRDTGGNKTYGRGLSSATPNTPPYGDSGGASRFFYVAKAPTKERPKVDGVAHPTVKPLTLMRWLCRLVTPPGGIVLEPFAGSGTTVQAAVAEGFRCIAIEREDDYLPLILSRLTPEESDDDGQLTLDTPA